MTDLTRVAEQCWDAIVVGTGMGGATIGYALARAGWRVLFCEKGRSAFHESRALRGDYAESHFTHAPPSQSELRDVLRRAGREADALLDLTQGKPRRFVPFIGSGTGGSSALYGMALERFFPADFAPRASHPDSRDSTLPERWPISYDELVPYYEAAENLYRVRGSPDPLKPPAASPAIAPAPEFSPATRVVAAHLRRQGLHPYHLPMACEYVEDCRGCQGFLCANACKHDSATVCLLPALASHGAILLDECEVVGIEADSRSAKGLVCRSHGVEVRLRGRIVILAAGALATPALLLRSASRDWPRGLANRSGMVGRNLMRHFVDLYAMFPDCRPAAEGNVKELGCNDFYVTGDGKFGALQSFGRLPPPRLMVEGLADDLRHVAGPFAASALRMAAPLAERVLARMASRALVLASILEDLPYARNEVLLHERGAGEVAIRYRIDSVAAHRIRHFRRLVGSVLRPHRVRLIKQAESNLRLAHVCGTCRFGTSAVDSVLDPHNRAHDFENLYVVDASFFPSSGGTNPALTVAANALRVAAHLIDR